MTIAHRINMFAVNNLQVSRTKLANTMTTKKQLYIHASNGSLLASCPSDANGELLDCLTFIRKELARMLGKTNKLEIETAQCKLDVIIHHAETLKEYRIQFTHKSLVTDKQVSKVIYAASKDECNMQIVNNVPNMITIHKYTVKELVRMLKVNKATKRMTNNW